MDDDDADGIGFVPLGQLQNIVDDATQAAGNTSWSHQAELDAQGGVGASIQEEERASKGTPQHCEIIVQPSIPTATTAVIGSDWTNLSSDKAVKYKDEEGGIFVVCRPCSVILSANAGAKEKRITMRHPFKIGAWLEHCTRSNTWSYTKNLYTMRLVGKQP
jgi:hypothetical protein